MQNKITAGIVTGIAALGALGGIASASDSGGGTATGASRLDDGKQLLGQAKVTEQQAIAAAQDAAKGDLNEVDLEKYAGKLVWTVDVGSSDVKVDAASGTVVDVSQDD